MVPTKANADYLSPIFRPQPFWAPKETLSQTIPCKKTFLKKNCIVPPYSTPVTASIVGGTSETPATPPTRRRRLEKFPFFYFFSKCQENFKKKILWRSMAQVRYTRTTRGKPKLIYQGFMFTFHRELNNGSAWRCIRRGTCLGRIVVDDDDKILNSSTHTHDPDWGSCKAAETVVAIKRAAETSRASTSAIIQSKVARVSYETASCQRSTH